MDQDELHLLAEKYLTDKHCVLWGRAFDLIQNKQAAVKWLTHLLIDIEAMR